MDTGQKVYLPRLVDCVKLASIWKKRLITSSQSSFPPASMRIRWKKRFIMLTIETSISLVVNEVTTGPTTSISWDINSTNRSTLSRVGLYFFRSDQKSGILGFRRNSVTYHTFFLVIIPLLIEYLLFLIKKWSLLKSGGIDTL